MSQAAHLRIKVVLQIGLIYEPDVVIVKFPEEKTDNREFNRSSRIPNLVNIRHQLTV